MTEPLGDPPRSTFTTAAQDAFRRGGRRRLWWSAAAAIVVLGLLIVMGPDRRSIQRRFRFYGAPGELRIMPEISIDEGKDRVHQLPKSLQVPPPPASIQIVPEDLDPRATEIAPKQREDREIRNEDAVEPNPDADTADKAQVELSLPSQTNPDWYILHMVRPEYPLAAPEQERRQPVIFVKAAIFVGPSGDVVERMILATDGSRVFAEEVLAKLAEWKFGWRVNPGSGRWIEMTWNFNSPYFSRASGTSGTTGASGPGD